MIRKTGSSVGMGVSAMAGPAEVAAIVRRPWEPTGAVAVDDLVRWAIVEQRAGDAVAGLYQLEAEVDGHQWQSRTTLAQVEQIAQLGCRVDVSGGRPDRMHPAAEAVAAAVRSLEDGGIVLRCARGGAPTRWREPARWLAPLRWEVEGERAVWMYAEKRQGAFCPLITVATAESVADGRAEYLAWWDALMMLGWNLGRKALGFTVLPPSVAREPWA